MYRSRVMAVLVAAASVLATVGAARAPAEAKGQLPTAEQAMEVFRDRWGPSDFRLKGTSSWVSHSVWQRVEPQYEFAPGTNEFTAEPMAARDLKPYQLEIFQRESHGRRQYQTVESVLETDGTTTFNYFPVFSGTPESMVLYYSVGVHQEPAQEVQEVCRDFVRQARHFQLCRVIRQDGFIAYNVKVREGEPAEDLPTVRQVLDTFRDQWGRASFRPTGISGWLPDVTWHAERALVFDAGENELTAEPTVLTPGQGGTVNVDWRYQRRTGPGSRVDYQVIQQVNGGERFDYFPPFFRGTPRGAIYQFENPRTFPDPRTNEREETRILRVNGEDFLIVRVVHASDRVNYWIARSA